MERSFEVEENKKTVKEEGIIITSNKQTTPGIILKDFVIDKKNIAAEDKKPIKKMKKDDTSSGSKT